MRSKADRERRYTIEVPTLTYSLTWMAFMLGNGHEMWELDDDKDVILRKRKEKPEVFTWTVYGWRW